ncbi:hypothetical protein INR49_011263, partial [Caranx melampygus]
MISGRKGRMDVEVSSNESLTQINNSLTEAEVLPSPGKTQSQAADLEAVVEGEGAPLTTEGYFSLRNCDSASLSSFSLDTPSLPRKHHGQDDTDSLVSTGTLVPEAIYLPPAGHRLITHSDWDSLNAQVSELRGEVSRLQAEKEELEKELDTQTNHTHKQVTMLQSQVQTSEALLQDLQKSFSQSQNAVQSRLAELSLSQRKMCSELGRLKGEEVEDKAPDSSSSFPATLQGAHCEERLRIEIVNLREQLDTRTEENELQSEQGSPHLKSNPMDLNVPASLCQAALHQQCLELRSQVISLRSQVETSQTVQRDFVQLSQSLQVKLELIRQAESLDQVREILGEGVSEAGSSPAEASYVRATNLRSSSMRMTGKESFSTIIHCSTVKWVSLKIIC